jgi:acyl-CoA synthetase (AMP-forming)/AMP-acid ligase II
MPARVAPFKKVRLVEFMDQIPKSPAGKILRRELLERERDRIGAAWRRRIKATAIRVAFVHTA